jgi:hypothetical protein
MEQIVWWKLILIVLGICLAAGVVGSIVGYLILRAQGRTTPFRRLFFRGQDSYRIIAGKANPANTSTPGAIPKSVIPQVADKPQQAPAEAARQARRDADENVLKVTQNWKAAMEAREPAEQAEAKPQPIQEAPTPAEPSQPVKKAEPTLAPEMGAHTSPLEIEVAGNLKIAASAREESPETFTTEEYDSKRGKINSLPAEIQERLTEAYTDMRLANTLVQLSKDANRRNNEMAIGYVQLCLKIADQLERVIPELKNSGV